MKAYFTASIVGKKHHLNDYLRIIEVLETQGIDVISDHIIKSTEAQIRIEAKEKRLEFHKKIEGWISNSDFVVAETSFPSISVGYEISLATHYLKPILILYRTGDAPSLLAHHKDENIVCEKYTYESLPDLINDFINFVRGNNDSRFTFFITSKIAAFLEEVSKKEKIPKSVYLRKLIEADITNHR